MKHANLNHLSRSPAHFKQTKLSDLPGDETLCPDKVLRRRSFLILLVAQDQDPAD